MLQDIRERAQGWVAWFIVILITIPFALWGISSYIGGGSAPIAAAVNGQEITDREFENRYRQYRQRLRQQLGANYRPELIDEASLRQEVLDSMIENRLILQQASDLGLSAGDELVRTFILSVPAFSVGGQFNQDAYERALRNQGMSPAGFETEVRASLVSEQLAKGINSTEVATAAELKELIRLRMQRRGLSYIVIPAQDFVSDIAVSEADIRGYYDSHSQQFMAPERVKVEYLELDINGIGETLEADEQAMLGYYEQHKSDYRVPEQRRASHILITLEEGAQQEEVDQALKRAEEALNRVRSGEDFASVAREVSQDPGSSDLGGDLDYFDRGVMDPAFDEKVFAMNAGEISDPIRTSFGFHIIKLTDVRAESGKPYEEIKEEIRRAYLKGEAERRFYEYAERLNDLAYEDPNSLQPAAEALGMKTRTSDWLTRDGGEGVFASSKVVDAAFSADVLLERNNSEAIEIGPEHMVVLRVVEHEESNIRPLDEVSPEITRLLEIERASARAREKGEQLLASLNGGESLESVAASAGLELVNLESVTRDNRDVPAPIQSSLFKLPHPREGARSFGDASLANGDFVVLALNTVEDGSEADVDKVGGKAAVSNLLQQARARAYYRHMVDNLRSRAKISVPGKEG